MHASLPELLSLRDAEPIDARVAQHVGVCAQCARELEQLSNVRASLQRLPQLDAPRDAWAHLQARVQQSSAGGSRRRWMSAAAAVATLAIIAGVLVRNEPDPFAFDPQQRAPATVTPEQPVEQLVARSQELEELLQALPDRPLIERVSTAATLDTIEQRIQWLDYQLSYAPEGTLDEAQSERLWRERVELMDSMVKVRYAEAGRLSF